MAKNFAIVIGINKYDHLPGLNYAKRDAQLMSEVFKEQVKCEKVFLFSDDSLSVGGKPTRPNLVNLRKVLLDLGEDLYKKLEMKAGDNFWFFFSGHGRRHNRCDYLMPCDGNPGDIEHTGIPINFIIEQLVA